MYTNYAEASKGTILPIVYNEQKYSLNPDDAIQLAESINKKFKELLLQKKNYSDACKELKLNKTICLFASENGYPKLFEISTNVNTTEKDFDHLRKLALYRNQVNCGIINEMEGERKALEISVMSKQN